MSFVFFVIQVSSFWRSLLGAIAFYTCIPLPAGWTLEFQRIARHAPLVGLLIGALLSLCDVCLQQLGVPVLTRSALVVVMGIAITGGLHLDGAMDTADGLAVQDPSRRLEVMTDSATGAFGAIAAIALILLKTAALTDIESNRWLALMAAAGWGRWGQVVAIARYPYLKPTGKGAFHKEFIRTPQDILLGLVLLLLLSGLQLIVSPTRPLLAVIMAVAGCLVALLTGAWFHHQLGGHTGDTYGAVVEWTEALLLCLLTTI
ncbi:adenosylcobinamide-GDP ribazoletransferase [Trichocoleus sp. FACHB-90]|uniref:adenosylcobinamide-GDP ribazoletransferase n=1 Tax=Cyanophyceae TaxID=3028117 RepID=UPI0016890E08|nr:adenosylcobinamide-GDP ribazoletransferase [Trichocoleus sp. FACHB-69]MBD1926615.1 adenosylcobinamide-GDP ribazoletransferase [Trichocoleus sp. FACHB-90]MBD1934787.1 adenosylcobinamide-GDP ribazoletransferase [Trichocoleus sp. FACHB-69]